MASKAGIDHTLTWTFGLLNCANKYLTAETFQNKVTANGNTLKKKQIWTMERVGDKGVALKSHLNRYLSIDRDGNITAASEEVGENETLTLETQSDGKIAIRSIHGRYLGGTGDNLTGFDKTISNTSLFTLRLAVHPQINLYSVNRRTFCHLVGDEIRCNEEIPWGFDALIVLEFHNGKYALRAANGKLLKCTGELVEQVSDATLYTIVFRNAQVAFRDHKGKFLTAVGAAAIVQSRKDSIGQDELFLLTDSHPQVRLTASNAKLVSIRDGLEVRANQTQAEPKDSEIFQMEAVSRTDRSGNVKFAFRGSNKKYWSSAPGIKGDKDTLSDPSSQFEIEWMGAMIALKGSNGKFISVKSNGKMSADSAELTDECKFVFEFINRPLLVLRGEHGFVGVKGGSGILECNRSEYDLFYVQCNAGTFHIQGANNKYVGVSADGTLTVTNSTPTDFNFELRAHTHMVIRAPNGKLLQGAQNGGFTATGSTICNSTLWEY